MDQTLLQDATGAMALMQYEQLEMPRVKVERALQYVDHDVIQLDFKNPDDHRTLRALCRKYRIHHSRPGNGICHHVHIERYARPGAILVGADPHTTREGGETWTLPCVRRELGDGAAEITVKIEESGDEFKVTHDFAAKERDILLHGGLLHYLSEQTPA